MSKTQTITRIECDCEYSFSQCPLPEGGDTIRLAYIETGKTEEQIHIRLQAHEITSPSTPAYVALSYVWGDETSKKEVLCEGGVLPVTANLYAALLRLRSSTDANGSGSSPELKGPFWIDAICIDQSNVAEKTSQVRKMALVYSSAEYVLAWLGEDDHEEVEELFDALENGIKEQENSQFTKLNTLQGLFREVIDPRVPVHENLLASVLGDTLPMLLDMMPGQTPMGEPSIEEMRACGKILRLLHKLTQRPWFTRLWVTQEILLSRKAILLSGPHKIPWHSFCIGENYILRTCQVEDPEQDGTLAGDNKYRLIADITAIPIMTKSVRMQYGSRNLGTLLPYLRKCKATDPRDKIFGVLGMASESQSQVMEADYSKGVAEVYAQATRSIIQENGSLVILSHMEENQKAQKLPSWVPDWSIPLHPSKEARIQEMDEAKHSASLELKSSIISQENPLQLSLEGIFIDEVDVALHGELGDQIHPQFMRILIRNGSRITAGEFKNVFESVSAVLEQVAQLRGLTGTYLSTWEPIELAYLCTISAGHISSGFKYTTDEAEKKSKEYMAVRQSMEIDELFFKADEMIQRLMGEASIQTQGKKVVKTKKGYLALVPRRTVKGDRVVILKGGPMPFILRGAEGGGYALLGECYVHGVMKGEAVVEAGDKKPVWETITIV